MQKKLPQHIAIVMDGNGRWAKKRFLPRSAGHRAGVNATRRIVKYCAQLSIPVLSIFAFSSENWQRPITEVSHLMHLFMLGLKREAALLQEFNIQLRFIGDRLGFSKALQMKIAEVEAMTAQNSGMVLLIAANYGGQWDICQATKKIAAQVAAQTISIDDINPQYFALQLAFADLPDPDLFIRTSGELRISNFMLWQLAYTELYFTDTLWPDFNNTELDKALNYFATRERRYGKSGEQVRNVC
jgi:undecaprenyl diphosphate synthase